MDNVTEIGVLDISIKDGEVDIFDGSAWVGVRFKIEEWQSVKEVVDRLIADRMKANRDSKRQPIKEQTLDEFNNARSVSYGSYIQVDPLTDK